MSTLDQLNGLLAQWANVVRHIERGYQDCIYEYDNDVDVRVCLGEALARSPHRLAPRAAARLAEWDRRFLAATRPGPATAPRDARPTSYEWLDRLPINPGLELLQDLREEGAL
jgi:hypothetical protein